MPIMLEKLYDALRAANVPDDKARAAAVEGANFDNRLASVEADLRLLKWMVATVIALLVLGFGSGLTLLLRVIDLIK